jgi:hypothetical protein
LVVDELLAAKDERPHDDLAQLVVGGDDREEILTIDLDHLARLDSAHTNESATTGEHAHVARELTRSICRDHRTDVAPRTNDFEGTAAHHEEP